MNNLQKLKDIITSVPEAPGVYLIKNEDGEVIYVGKAKSLRKRLSSYLGRELSSKTLAMMSHAADIDFRLCSSESLALLREANLIHRYKPKYNVSLRDDKSFPMVKISNEEFPAVCITRKKENDGAHYFGPYTSAGLLREALKIIRRQFPYRSCKKLPSQPCMYYRIGLSPAPCIGRIDKESYLKTIESIIMILEEKTDALIEKLTRDMNESVKGLKFEEAARIRDHIEALSAFGQSQTLQNKKNELEDLENLLKLNKLPQRIEAFDISNISGQEATGAMVSFYKGMADKNNYRRFRIKSVEGINDYQMLKEVVKRRYARVIKERLNKPDLILIDGGKAHLLAAQEELKRLNLRIPVASIAKDKENIYILENQKPIHLNQDTPALNLVRRIRDEAHRFAIKYHHLLRRKRILGK